MGPCGRAPQPTNSFTLTPHLPRLSHIVHGASFGTPLCIFLIIGPIYVMLNKHDRMHTNLPPGWVDVPFHFAFFLSTPLSSPVLYPRSGSWTRVYNLTVTT